MTTILMLNNKEQKMKLDIMTEQKKLEQQIKTFTDLKNALQMQFNVLTEANKENEVTN